VCVVRVTCFFFYKNIQNGFRLVNSSIHTRLTLFYSQARYELEQTSLRTFLQEPSAEAGWFRWAEQQQLDARSGRDPAPIDTAAKLYFVLFSPSERRR